MKKVIFLMSHFGSGSNALYALLASQPRIMGVENENVYDNQTSLIAVAERKHKLNNASRMYLDHILYNFQYSLKPDPWVKMIFLVREPEGSIDYMVNRKIFKRPEAKMYYLYRLRRICELAKKNPNSIFLTYSILREGRGLKELNDYLELKENISFSQEFNVPSGKSCLHIREYEDLSAAYEKYIYYVGKVMDVHIT
jgi:hypothetical protein